LWRAGRAPAVLLILGLVALAPAALAQEGSSIEGPGADATIEHFSQQDGTSPATPSVPLTRDDDAAVPAGEAGAALAPNPPPAAPAPRRHRSGLIGVLQGWFEDATGPDASDPLRQAKDAIDDLGDKARRAGDRAVRATQESAESLSRVPVAGSVKGREVCAVAPNGAPDCAAAANRLCKAKGFAGGKSADFVSSEKCPAQVWLSGGKNKAGCKTETYLTSALCQ